MLYLKCSQIKWICGVSMLASIITVSLSNSLLNRNEVAKQLTLDTTISFYNMFEQCMDSSMPSMKFPMEDLKKFVNSPSRTTVGYAPRFTSNRKFFANLLSSQDFKAMLAEDEKQIKEKLLEKMKYCDSIVMDQNLLQLMYDREVDQSKM